MGWLLGEKVTKKLRITQSNNGKWLWKSHIASRWRKRSIKGLAGRCESHILMQWYDIDSSSLGDLLLKLRNENQ